MLIRSYNMQKKDSQSGRSKQRSAGFPAWIMLCSLFTRTLAAYPKKTNEADGISTKTRPPITLPNPLLSQCTFLWNLTPLSQTTMSLIK